MKKAIFALLCMASIVAFGAIAACTDDNKNDVPQTTTVGYVDLGLPSGTLWKTVNEDGVYNFNAAIAAFGDSMPTKAQFDELTDECDWRWNASEKGYDITGPNGNAIFMPAAGYVDCVDDLRRVGELGFYWSRSTAFEIEENFAWDLWFTVSEIDVKNSGFCHHLSVRLVKNQQQ